jgi:glycosyltransferase involved in cell wall biosynthesis
MRLLVAPHDLQIGGSQINAIDLAAGAAEAGHDVIVYGVDGPLVARIESLGLEFVSARPLRYRPAPSRIAQLAALAHRRRLDLVHAYEWPPCLDAYYGAHFLLGVPLVCTVLSMSVSPLIPRSIPLVMGTEALGNEARRTHRAPVWVLEPPIDVDSDHPGIDGESFRRSSGAQEDGSLLIVTVSRLAIDLKLDALVEAIDAIDLLAGRLPVRLAIVGGGPAAAALQARGEEVNRRHGSEIVRFLGPMDDPRSAYAGADVVVGMGSSALRALSIGRPVVVQGEQGFSKPFTPETLPYFLNNGFYGRAERGWTVERFADQLHDLLADSSRRAALGAFGRRIVVERFSLSRALARQLDIYDAVLARGRSTSPADAARAAGRAVRLEIDAHDPRRKRTRRRGEQSLLSAASRLTEQHTHA